MTDRELMQQALEALDSGVDVQMERVVWTEYDSELVEQAITALRERLAQREGLTPEERKRRCGELLVQAQYMDSEEYLRWMHDSTKRPWVGLTKEEAKEISMANRPYVVDMIAALEARLKEKNT